MIATAPRNLSIAQHARLDRTDEDAEVVGWDDRVGGPIVAFPDGRCSALNAYGRFVSTRAAA